MDAKELPSLGLKWIGGDGDDKALFLFTFRILTQPSLCCQRAHLMQPNCMASCPVLNDLDLSPSLHSTLWLQKTSDQIKQGDLYILFPC